MGVTQEPISITDNVVVLGPFSAANLAADQADQAAALPGGNTGIPALVGGSVVGLLARLSAAATAGQVTVGVTVGGTEDADSTQTLTTGQSIYKSFEAGQIPFSAGNLIGVEWNTNAAWNGTTADLDVFVLALFEKMEF